MIHSDIDLTEDFDFRSDKHDKGNVSWYPESPIPWECELTKSRRNSIVWNDMSLRWNINDTTGDGLYDSINTTVTYNTNDVYTTWNTVSTLAFNDTYIWDSENTAKYKIYIDDMNYIKEHKSTSVGCFGPVRDNKMKYINLHQTYNDKTLGPDKKYYKDREFGNACYEAFKRLCTPKPQHSHMSPYFDKYFSTRRKLIAREKAMAKAAKAGLSGIPWLRKLSLRNFREYTDELLAEKKAKEEQSKLSLIHELIDDLAPSDFHESLTYNYAQFI